ncbi:MAG: 3'-5' exonuclease, partial [Patescibacteria group bacterium]
TIYTEDRGFIYQNTIDSRIKQLKSNGISPTDLEEIIRRNEIELEYLCSVFASVFTQRMSEKVYDQLRLVKDQIAQKYQENIHKIPKLGEIPSLSRKYTEKFIELINLYTTNPDLKSKPLSDFKSKYTYKSIDGNNYPNEKKYHNKLKDLLEIYNIYEDKINETHNIDYDDMVRMAVEALESDQDLRTEIQSKYQYVLVDEFQDTSALQLKLVNSLLEMEISNGKPNIMVVGDDDQSIYKFQGANVENLSNFVNYFPNSSDVKMIVLNTNYRSKKNLVELSQEIVDYSMQRFAKQLGNLDKSVRPHNQENGNIQFLSYNTQYDEVADICKRINQLNKDGVDLSEICILARNHKQIVPYARQLEKLQIPLKYEKGQDILKSQHVLELIKLARLILLMADEGYTDIALSDVLRSEFWRVKGVDLYALAAKVRTLRKLRQDYTLSWLDVMLEAKENNLNPYFAEVANWLIEVATLAKRYSAERLLDILIGQHSDEGSEQSEKEIDPKLDPETKQWREELKKLTDFSPFGRYYYNYNRLNLDYLSTLSALKTLVHKVREYKQNNFLKIGDLVEFFDFHERERIAIIDNNVFNQNAHAVTLMTGHKAKGLEFEHVFVISSNEEIWFDSKGRNLLPLPANMPYEALPEDNDDHLRLYYVAITRAKNDLYITRYENSESAKLMEPIGVIVNKEFTKVEVPLSDLAEVVTDNIFDVAVNVDSQMKDILTPLLEDYRMSITHLWNYIDLDNEKGPKYFIENNLLRFPCSMNPSSSYGTAIHEAIYHLYVQSMNKNFSLQDMIFAYVQSLSEQNLAEKDYKHYEKMGIGTIEYFYNTHKLEEKYNVEVKFNLQDVFIGEAKVTGAIDKIVINEETKTLDVYDYKTGKAFDSFAKASAKRDNYLSQLLYYKLLIENSNLFENKYTVGKLALDFVEKGDYSGIKYLDYSNLSKEIKELESLINVVYKKIVNLDFEIPATILELKSGKTAAFKEWLLSQ